MPGPERIKIAFASGTDELNVRLIEKMRLVFPELPLYVVSEFPPEGGGYTWVRYNNGRHRENFARCRAMFKGKRIRLAGVLLVPNVPFRFMRLIALVLAPLYFLAVNEQLNDFMLRPQSLPTIARHFFWRARNFFRWHFGTQPPESRHRFQTACAAALARLAARFRIRRGDMAATPISRRTYVDESYLRSLVGSIHNRKVFLDLWREAVGTLASRALSGDEAAGRTLRAAPRIALGRGPGHQPPFPEAAQLALTDGSVAFFPGRPPTGKPRVLVASPYMPFPLSHGGAVRIYNLMRRAAEEFDQILAVFTETDAHPPPELTAICVEVATVRRSHTHCPPYRGRPEMVEEFWSPAFEAALMDCVRRWRPQAAQLEFTQMAQYESAAAPAPTILVEHDITFDLHEQLARVEGGFDNERQARLWRKFETRAWDRMDRVVTMSEKDRLTVGSPLAVTLPNGVDLERFRPSAVPPDPRRLLFIASFAHLPNLTALEFFLREVWPLLDRATLHVIAGQRHEYYLDHYRHRAAFDLNQPGIELDGFVSDVRGAYARAAVAILPLVASAGTNIKVLEAMAAGKAIVSTPAGVNGLDLIPGEEFLLAADGPTMAAAINSLLDAPDECDRLGSAARRRAELQFGWDAIARKQSALYKEIIGTEGMRP